MKKRILAVLGLVFSLVEVFQVVADERPIDADIQLKSPGVSLSLIAEDPKVCTPTGIDVDDEGHLWVISSHTHFRPDDYDGPKHDEVIVLDGEQRRVFYNATDATMDLELGVDGWVYLAERDRILRVRDSDGDGVGDVEESLAVLATEADYPHNGLSGLAWHPSGDLVFALGENFAKPWTLTSVDGSKCEGTGEGGIFRCTADGRTLRRIAKGLWNPFGVCVRKDGSMFASENDPGARPPCRLLHIVEGGDYGFQRKYGPSPVHPFVCWNGELRGTLPMLHALGEAPCGIVPLGDAGVIVTSWTENRIDFYPLIRKGHSYESHRVVLASGSRDFRPTCIAASRSNGESQSLKTFYFTDWTIGSYQLHGRGRVWRLEVDTAKADWSRVRQQSAEPPKDLLSGKYGSALQLTASSDPFVVSAAIRALSGQKLTATRLLQFRTPICIGGLLAMKSTDPQDVESVKEFLIEGDLETQFEAIRWIADEELHELRELIVTRYLRNAQVEFRLFEAALACINTLDGNAAAGVTDKKILLDRVLDESASPTSRAFALRLLPQNVGQLKFEKLEKMVAIDDPVLAMEVARWWSGTSDEEAQQLLMEIAEDASLNPELRAQAIASLGSATEDNLEQFMDLSASSLSSVRDEALRALRFCSISDQHRLRLQQLKGHSSATDALLEAVLLPNAISNGRPSSDDTEAWSRLIRLSGTPDVAAGRRIFFNSKLAMCSQCHRMQGRGGVLGPDLSAFSEFGDADDQRALLGFLQPSRDIDPQYFPRILITEDGQTFTGMLLRDGGSGREFYRDATGKEVLIKSDEIVARRESHVSMMPADLHKSMTIEEIRDLLAYVNARPDNKKVERPAKPKTDKPFGFTR